LVDFENAVPLLAAQNAKVVALSVDDRETTQALVDGIRVASYPVLHSADAQQISEATGAMIERKRGFLHATGFLLNPEGKVSQAVYASGPIGRLSPLDTLKVLEFMQRPR
jgi:alkyl hydroperoxide reductase subunit AhpC